MKSDHLKPERLAFIIRRRRAHADRTARRLSGRLAPALVTIAAVLFTAACLLVVAGGFLFADLTRGLPSPQNLEILLDKTDGLFLQPTRIFDRSGEHLLLTLENPGITRQYLPVDPAAEEHISPALVKFLTTQDDPDFRQHPGISFSHLLDPVPQTFAEKLADRLLLSREESGQRKALRMRLLALQITAKYGREKVLEWYLNSAYFGHMAYGAADAARLYFDKSASDLTLAESALLAEIERSPALNPLDAPAAAEEQKMNSLNRLLLAEAITPDEFLQAEDEKISLRESIPAPISEAPAFTHYLLAQLGKTIGTERLEHGGLTINSTLDFDLQTNLECSLRVQLERLVENESRADSTCPAAGLLPTLPASDTPYPSGLQAAGIVVDPQTGEVLALAGRMDLSSSSSSISGMKSGSILSPLAALSAFTRGMSPAALVWDVPSSLPEELAEYRLPDKDYQGPMRLRIALGNDILTPLTNLLVFLGPQDVLRQAAPLGLAGLSRENAKPDLFYQGVDVNLVEVAQMYSAFDGLGRINGLPDETDTTVLPVSIHSIIDTIGQELWNIKDLQSREVVSPPLAYLIHNILADENARRLSLGYPNALEIGQPAGAKTATAAGGKETWAVGYTPQRLAAVWLGLPADSDAAANLDVRAAAGVWHAVMQYSLRSLPVQEWSTPTGVVQVEVCDPSGLLPSADCPTTVREVFLSGTEPAAVDTLYKKIQINRETGRIATVFTPADMVEEKVYINYPKEAREWAIATGQPAAPEDYDVIQAPPPQPGVNITHPPAFAYIHGLVQIMGSAAEDGFFSYSLQVGEGLNPSTWTTIGAESRQRVEGGQLGLWNTAGLNGLYTIRLMVIREDKKVSTAVVQVSVDNTPAVLTVPYPEEGQVFEGPSAQSITFQADASDLIGIKKVEWLVDGQAAGERVQAPFSLPWAGTTGEHTLVVKAYDLAGNVTESAPVRFVVR